MTRRQSAAEFLRNHYVDPSPIPQHAKPRPYDPIVFSRGQRYRSAVIAKLAAERIDFFRLPAEVDAGEVVRRCFYQPMSVDYCVDAIKGAIGL